MDILQKSFDKAVQKLAESANSGEELEKLANSVPERIIPDSAIENLRRERNGHGKL